MAPTDTVLQMNPLAIHRGPPSRNIIIWILLNTKTDNAGRQFYKRNDGSWRRLRSTSDFADLNRRLVHMKNLLSQYGTVPTTTALTESAEPTPTEPANPKTHYWQAADSDPWATG